VGRIGTSGKMEHGSNASSFLKGGEC
jgi:hypothetical protein